MGKGNRDDSLIAIDIEQEIKAEPLESAESIEINVDGVQQYPEISNTLKAGSDDSDNSNGVKGTVASDDEMDEMSYLGSIATNIKRKTAVAAQNVKVKTAQAAQNVRVTTIIAMNGIIPKYEPLPNDTFLALVFACAVP